MRITFIVKYRNRRKVTEYFLSLIPISKWINVAEVTEYNLDIDPSKIEQIDYLIGEVCAMLSKKYAGRIISVEACDFGDAPESIVFRPLASALTRGKIQ